MLQLVLLTAALLPLLLAPKLAQMAQSSPRLVRWLEIAVSAILVLLAVFHLLPEAWEVSGWLILVPALIGFTVPVLFHRRLNLLTRRTRIVTLALPVIGLVLHAVLDGLALFTPVAEHGGHAAGDGWLAFAVILHRLPVALVIWWLVQPKLGPRVAYGLLAIVALGTVIGFFSGHQIWPLLQPSAIALLQAAIAGMLLHVIVERHGILEPRPRRATSQSV